MDIQKELLFDRALLMIIMALLVLSGNTRFVIFQSVMGVLFIILGIIFGIGHYMER